MHIVTRIVKYLNKFFYDDNQRLRIMQIFEKMCTFYKYLTLVVDSIFLPKEHIQLFNDPRCERLL